MTTSFSVQFPPFIIVDVEQNLCGIEFPASCANLRLVLRVVGVRFLGGFGKFINLFLHINRILLYNVSEIFR